MWINALALAALHVFPFHLARALGAMRPPRAQRTYTHTIMTSEARRPTASFAPFQIDLRSAQTTHNNIYVKQTK